MTHFDPRHHTHLYEYKGKKFRAKSKDQIMRRMGLNVYCAAERAKVRVINKYLTSI